MESDALRAKDIEVGNCYVNERLNMIRVVRCKSEPRGYWDYYDHDLTTGLFLDSGYCSGRRIVQWATRKATLKEIWRIRSRR